MTQRLGGVNYVFWGGREGYSNLYNTDLKRELDHAARFFHLAVEYKKKIGFKGQFLIEPKPKEPTVHQYDFDCAAVVAFLRGYGLADDFKLNVETNHATLAGHTMMHELTYASAQGLLGSMDANRGDLLLGWDTDQFPTDLYLTAQCMLVILGQGGLAPGGVNFDAKVRRESFEPVDSFHAHIGGMDAFAHGLKIAAKIRADGVLGKFVKERYTSWDEGIGKKIEARQAGFDDLEKYMLEVGDAKANTSGRRRCWRPSSTVIRIDGVETPSPSANDGLRLYPSLCSRMGRRGSGAGRKRPQFPCKPCRQQDPRHVVHDGDDPLAECGRRQFGPRQPVAHRRPGEPPTDENQNRGYDPGHGLAEILPFRQREQTVYPDVHGFHRKSSSCGWVRF